MILQIAATNNLVSLSVHLALGMVVKGKKLEREKWGLEFQNEINRHIYKMDMYKHKDDANWDVSGSFIENTLEQNCYEE